MTTHTPGPWMTWRNKEKDMRQGFSIDNQGGAKVAREVTTLENARLIAAAPTLLEACQAAKMILRQVDEIIGSGTEADVSGSGGSTVLNASEVRPALQSLRAAIAQALGQ